MVISFKDQALEARLAALGKEPGISASLVARRDLERFYWLMDDHTPVQLDRNEFLAVCSIVKSTGLFDEPTRIKKMALLVEDCIRSTTNSTTGEYSKVERFGIDVDALCAKLRAATPLELTGLVARCEEYPQADLDNAPGQWQKRQS